MKPKIILYSMGAVQLLITGYVATPDRAARYWPLWLVSTICLFIALFYYAAHRGKKVNPYEIDKLETLTKAYKEVLGDKNKPINKN